MKYLTKEYELKKQFQNCLEDYDVIPDGMNFEDVYQEKLEERLKKAEKDFNTPLKMMKSREETINTYEEKAYPKYDLVSKRVMGYLTLDEVLKSYDYQAEKLQRMFDNRGEFDKKHVIDLFENNFKESLDNNQDIPFQYREKIDPKFLALHVIPKKEYEEISLYQERCKAFVLKQERLEEENFQLIKNHFSNMELDLKKKNFTPLVQFISKEDTLTFLFHFEGLKSHLSSGFSSYVFKKISHVDKEDDISFSIDEDRQVHYQNYWLIKEVELSFQEKKNIAFLLKKKNDETLSSISFDFEEGEIFKNI